MVPKPLRCLLWEPHLTGTWGWGRRFLPWDATQKWDQVTVIVPRLCTKIWSKTDGDSVSLCLLGLWLKASQEDGDMGLPSWALTTRLHSTWGRDKICWGAASDSRGKGGPKEQDDLHAKWEKAGGSRELRSNCSSYGTTNHLRFMLRKTPCQHLSVCHLCWRLFCLLSIIFIHEEGTAKIMLRVLKPTMPW